MVVIRLGRKLLANRMIRGTVITPVEQTQRDKDGRRVTFIIYLLFLLLFNNSFRK